MQEINDADVPYNYDNALIRNEGVRPQSSGLEGFINPGMSSHPLPGVTRASTFPFAPLPNPSAEMFQLVRDTSTYNNRLPASSAQHYAHPPSPYVAPVIHNQVPVETTIDVQTGLPADLVDPPVTSVQGVPNTSVPIDSQSGLPADLVDPPITVPDQPGTNSVAIQGSHAEGIYSNTQSQESDYTNKPRDRATRTAPTTPPGGGRSNTLTPPSGFSDNDDEEDEVDGALYDGSGGDVTLPYVNAPRPSFV